jgi:hypothetical protein
MVIHPRFERNRIDRSAFPWIVRMSFLGIEGAQRLEAIARGDVGRSEPPKLVVYE